jgi:hypothetical protein
LSFLRVWGCEAHVKKLQPDKLESKAEKWIFVGYAKDTFGYTFYHPAEGKTFCAKTGHFLEKEFVTRDVGGRKVELDEIDDPSLEIPSSAMEAVPDVPSIKEEEGAPDENQGFLPSNWTQVYTSPQIPGVVWEILYYRSCWLTKTNLLPTRKWWKASSPRNG